MNNWRKQILLAVTFSCLVWAGGCGKSGDQGGAAAGTIKVGEFASLTGKEAAFG